MFAIIGFILGALLGAWRAKSLGGTRADLAQYAASCGLLGLLLGIGLSLILYRFLA
ncbi:hypothetical protein [Pseudogemmobacter faecipullorum]|uniref:Apolipoprotein acyltransferase n=1 Tax=Pseudogemmobacter faecipullorum TaxID=2755041 RepID=A0ABS8CI84_9RHOB|nr:hypothetical protein [Pseudogemmobacter faecipullorum]MCB5409117.1 hypothetical protein [Pseudogemmobacter faecipullorum]